MKLNNIPNELKQHNYWCVWKDKKMPYNPKTNELAKTNNPDTFADFDTACKAFEQGGYKGMGIGIFNGISAIDIDHCITDGELSEMAKDIINQMNSYTEISPSGTGIRIIFTVKDFNFDKQLYYINNQKRKLEVYISGATNKYVTITGNSINDNPIIDGTSALPQILDTYMRRQQSTKETTHMYEPNFDKIDKEFLQIGLTKDKELIAYYQGSRPKNNESVDDFAFLNKLLYWCNGNKSLALQTFLSSPYVLRKDEEHKEKLKRQDYLTNTMINAMPPTTAKKDYEKYRQQLQKKQLSDNTNSQSIKPDNKPIPKLNVISAQDLQNTDLPPVKFLVEDILPEGTSILSASPKMGKSWFVLDMGLKIALGEKFLNKQTTQTGVLYLALEDNLQRLKDRTNKVLNNRTAPEMFDFLPEAPTLDENLLDVLDVYIKEHSKIKLIIIDTLQKIRSKTSGKGNMYQQDYNELGELKKFVDKHKISLILVHHNRKMKDTENNFNMMSGTNGIMGAVDTIFMIDKKSRKDRNATLYITGRDVKDNNIVMHFNQNTFRWEVVGSADEIEEKEKRQQYEDSLVVKTIKTLLKESPNNRWRGKVSQLLNEGVRITNTPIATSAKNLGGILNDKFSKDLFTYDKIIHQTTPNGNAGKFHDFYYYGLKEETPSINLCEFITAESDNDTDEYEDVEF